MRRRHGCGGGRFLRAWDRTGMNTVDAYALRVATPAMSVYSLHRLQIGPVSGSSGKRRCRPSWPWL